MNAQHLWLGLSSHQKTSTCSQCVHRLTVQHKSAESNLLSVSNAGAVYSAVNLAFLGSIKFAVQMKAVGTLHRASLFPWSSWLFVFDLYHTYTYIMGRNIALLRLALWEEAAEIKRRSNSVGMNRKLPQIKTLVDRKQRWEKGGQQKATNITC